ncbi:phosphotransferase [Streptosporangium soli]|nr:aminoglycoside phosphotransferase family protein [Streptosporangium sp. KLBMP 9127]
MVMMSARLRAVLGEPAEVESVQSSPRSEVWMATFGGTETVVKRVVGGSDATERCAREIIALGFAARAEPPVAARLITTDPGAATLVLERLAEQPAGDDWPVRYAESLARLHAVTGPADEGALPRWQPPTAADADAFLAFARALEVPVPAGVPGELAALLARLDAPGHHAMLHGDPCPDNSLLTPGGVRFIDLEQAALGNGLMELAYLRVGFPTCWCSLAIPGGVLAEAEERYRAVWKAAKGDDVSGSLADACAGWLLRGDALVERARRGTVDHLAVVPGDDWTWGTATARQRLVHRLDVVAGTHELGDLSPLAAALRDRMLTRWPTLTPLPARP